MLLYLPLLRTLHVLLPVQASPKTISRLPQRLLYRLSKAEETPQPRRLHSPHPVTETLRADLLPELKALRAVRHRPMKTDRI